MSPTALISIITTGQNLVHVGLESGQSFDRVLGPIQKGRFPFSVRFPYNIQYNVGNGTG
jgi:hypothetical protein